ncbi:MAG: NADH-quinone oxidoreductase subunit NuoK [Bdellovibrionaceae bacterium]|jgi:NADH-quinone oxidoreductase subunit K|nr:NADH-quinone oxidoreductase subunit NuoK [Pseudobdellovibrionaceae bacterium]
MPTSAVVVDSISSVGLNHYLILSAILFSLGVVGVLMRRNIIVILMSIELMLNAVNIAFVAFSRYLQNMDGQAMVFFVMTIAAAEAAVGLALATTIFKKFREVNIRYFEHLKG